MAITLDELRGILEAEDLEPYTNGQDALVLALVHDGELLNLHVRLLEEGAAVRWRIPYFAKLPAGRRRGQVLLKLLERNLVLKFLKFCVDPADGEISLEMAWPLMDGPLTQEQVHRCLFAFYGTALDERSALETLLRTGAYPQDTPDQVEESVRRLFEASGADDAPGEDPPETGPPAQCMLDDLLTDADLAEGELTGDDDLAATTPYDEDEDY